MSLIYDVERCLRSKGPMTELDLAIELDAESKRISSAIRSLLSRRAVEKDGGRWRLRSSDAQAPGPILSERQQTIVTFTRRYGPIAATKIAEGCGVPGGSIHGLLMRLQELGVIRKGAGGWEAIEDDSTHAAESAEESADKRAPGAWAPGEWDRMERERVEKELAWVRTELSVIKDFVTDAFPFAPKDLPTRDRLFHVAQRIDRLESSEVVHESILAELRAGLRGEVLDELRTSLRGEVLDELRAGLRGEVLDELRTSLRGEVLDELRAGLQGNVQLRAELRDELRAGGQCCPDCGRTSHTELLDVAGDAADPAAPTSSTAEASAVAGDAADPAAPTSSTAEASAVEPAAGLDDRDLPQDVAELLGVHSMRGLRRLRARIAALVDVERSADVSSVERIVADAERRTRQEPLARIHGQLCERLPLARLKLHEGGEPALTIYVSTDPYPDETADTVGSLAGVYWMDGSWMLETQEGKSPVELDMIVDQVIGAVQRAASTRLAKTREHLRALESLAECR